MGRCGRWDHPTSIGLVWRPSNRRFYFEELKQKKLKYFNHEDRILIYAHLPYFISSSFHEELQNNDRFIIFLKNQIFSVRALRVCDI